MSPKTDARCPFARRALRLPVGRILMEDLALQRQQFIVGLLPQQPENIVDAAMCDWEQLAAEIVSIVGEIGFTSLYERALHMTQPTFPWILPASSSTQWDQHRRRYLELEKLLAGQTPEIAAAAHSLLLTSFTDILASLIGEQLTLNILQAAWGNVAPVTAGKELVNE